jgi:hypothetical protein
MQPDEGLFTRQLPGDRFRAQTDPVLQARAVGADHTAQLADAYRQRQVRQRPETVKANVNAGRRAAKRSMTSRWI